jgi:hypothetical protein
MKYFKLFEQFISEHDSEVNESTKWTDREFKSLTKFAEKLSKIDPKEFDPTEYSGVQSAVINLKSVTDAISIEGDLVWILQNKDKCQPRKWNGNSWEDTVPEEADKGLKVAEDYIKECEALFQGGIKAINLIEKGEGAKLASMLPKLESDSDKLSKSNKKWQKARAAGTWFPKPDYRKEEDKFKFQFKTKVLKQYQNTTSNKGAIDEIQKTIDNDANRT